MDEHSSIFFKIDETLDKTTNWCWIALSFKNKKNSNLNFCLWNAGSIDSGVDGWHKKIPWWEKKFQFMYFETEWPELINSLTQRVTSHVVSIC